MFQSKFSFENYSAGAHKLLVGNSHLSLYSSPHNYFSLVAVKYGSLFPVAKWIESYSSTRRPPCPPYLPARIDLRIIGVAVV